MFTVALENLSLENTEVDIFRMAAICTISSRKKRVNRTGEEDFAASRNAASQRTAYLGSGTVF